MEWRERTLLCNEGESEFIKMMLQSLLLFLKEQICDQNTRVLLCSHVCL